MELDSFTFTNEKLSKFLDESRSTKQLYFANIRLLVDPEGVMRRLLEHA